MSNKFLLDTFDTKINEYKLKFDKHRSNPELMKVIGLVKASIPVGSYDPELVEIAKMNVEIEALLERMIENGIPGKIVYEKLQKTLI